MENEKIIMNIKEKVKEKIKKLRPAPFHNSRKFIN